MAEWKGSRFSGLLRVVRIETADGETIDAPDARMTGQPEPAPAADLMTFTFKPVEYTARIPGDLLPGAVRLLHYMTNVRPWLHCPIEYRMN